MVVEVAGMMIDYEAFSGRLKNLEEETYQVFSFNGFSPFEAYRKRRED